MKRYRPTNDIIADDGTICCYFTGVSRWGDELMFNYTVDYDGQEACIASVSIKEGQAEPVLFLRTGTPLLQDRIDDLSALISQHVSRRLEQWAD